MACRSDDSGPDYYDEYKDCERKLCAARWLLLQLVKVCDANDIHLDGSLKSHIIREKKEQLKHRQADRDFMLNKIKNDIANIIRAIKEIRDLGGQPAAKILIKKSELKRKMGLIKDISDEELLEGSWLNPVMLIDNHE